MLALPGSAYVYQGEELGLPEVLDLPDQLRQDPAFRRTGESRDGCRVPLPWSGVAPPYDFGPAGSGASWLPAPPNWAPLTAQAQADDPTSTLELYRAALRLRHELPALAGGGAVTWLQAPPGVLAFSRPGTPDIVCAINLSGAPVTLAGYGEPLLSSAPVGVHGTGAELPVDAAAWFAAPAAG
jgi:alpha-glucosidase